MNKYDQFTYEELNALLYAVTTRNLELEKVLKKHGSTLLAYGQLKEEKETVEKLTKEIFKERAKYLKK